MYSTVNYMYRLHIQFKGEYINVAKNVIIQLSVHMPLPSNNIKDSMANL